MTTKIYYEKRGRRYVPVAEYDNDLLNSFPKGNHLVMCYPGGASRRYNIEPNYAAMIAAGRVAADAMMEKLCDASTVQPTRRPLTQAETDAWNNLIAVWGEEARGLRHPSVRDVVEAGVQAMIEEAQELMTNPTVCKAYEKFLMIAELSKENK